MTKAIYIAASLESADVVRVLGQSLRQFGWTITHDWTTHGELTKGSEIARAAEQYIEAINDADVILVLLPGGRGTHAELGIALAFGRPVVLYPLTPDALMSTYGRVCAFYLHPLTHAVPTGAGEEGIRIACEEAIRDRGL